MDHFSFNEQINICLTNKTEAIKPKQDVNTQYYLQTIEHLFTIRGINDESHFLKVKEKLYKDSNHENANLLAYLTKKTIMHKGISYALSEEDSTATVLRHFSARNKVAIRRAIMHDPKEYVITEICDNSLLSINSIKTIGKFAFSWSSIREITIASRVTTIKSSAFFGCREPETMNFSKGSKLITLETDFLTRAMLERISIPPSVLSFSNGWCHGITRLSNIEVLNSKEEANIVYLKDTFLLGKSGTKSGSFDAILFARRGVEYLIDPVSVKPGFSFAFNECKTLKSVDFSNCSELSVIGEYSLSNLPNLETLALPSCAKRFDEGWSHCTSVLKNIQVLKACKN